MIYKTLPIEQQKLLDLHLTLVLEENKISNLTRITDEGQGLLLHVEDSLQGLPEVNDAPDGVLVDLGTGGGFPGIPLSIVTERITLLVDSVGKKTKALDRIINALGINDKTSTFTGRAEELALQQPSFASVITARALSSMPSLLELASPLLMEGGRLVCYKGQDNEKELEHAKALEDKLGMRLVSHRSFKLADQVTNRSIFSFDKTHEPKVKLPRRPGMAQKRPY